MSRSAIRGLASEFLIIVLGVLTALGVDEWRETRDDRARESQYVTRLIADLVQDSLTMATAVRVGAAKAAALDSIVANLSDPSAIRRSPRLAWPEMGFTYARPELQTTTFDELTASGALGSIRDAQVREEVGRHYLSATHQYERLDDRRTRLAWKVAELFPGTSWGSGTNVDDQDVDAAFFSSPNVDERLRALLGLEYHGLVNQERIYARSIDQISSLILARTLETLAMLRDYELGFE